jgi:plasmid stabilization system protein ParE
MVKVLVLDTAGHRIDAIYRYTLDNWGQAQADIYIRGLFEAFNQIEDRGIVSFPIPAEFGVKGYYFRYGKHYIYWKRLSTGDIGIVTILHERMHRVGRLKDEYGL